MTELIVGFVAGLIVGWNLFPQPSFIKALWTKITGN